ncbi:hypothetical protein [Flammeovirga kamogawensis]|uniref:Lipoprotein n=1 Tax=Flammeovirga kamogawensis TaxID=373891 RepID=A0ABX8H1C3_9BACT|nr:hypothetical protein [Flammeovirga kamogawensis]MBB6462385.1 hypothetical protein [Flammeovirga kamogawensis]QWG09498.1 hypothetical protein KM029_23105 [Flammeovirga kamogawensis]TRX65014.1 hypothetical protein EO216_21005 [Flammeovirga kamogawensis]
MKKILLISILAISMVSCNDGREEPQPLKKDLKEYLLEGVEKLNKDKKNKEDAEDKTKNEQSDKQNDTKK